MAATILFDLDNTLYSFDSTGAHNRIRANVVAYLANFFGISTDEARARDQEYFRANGLTCRALALQHGHTTEDLRRYYDQVLDCGLENELKPDPRLREGLERLAAAGHDLWIMTNAHDTHATRCLRLLGVADLFQRRIDGPATDSEDSEASAGARAPHVVEGSGGTLEWKLIDCFDMWAAEEGMQSKPFPGAYHHARRRTGAHCRKRVVVMVEDTAANLVHPHEDGWVPVWVGHGKPVPESAPPCHAHDTIYDALDALPEAITVKHAELQT